MTQVIFQSAAVYIVVPVVLFRGRERDFPLRGNPGMVFLFRVEHVLPTEPLLIKIVDHLVHHP